MAVNMEELQYVLEDAQYVNAINVCEGARPIKSWSVPTEEDLTKWKRGLKQKWERSKDRNPLNEPLEFLWVLSSSVGFFIFSSYLKETVGEYLEINFVEEVLRWRKTTGYNRKVILKKILSRYLLPRPRDPGTNQIRFPTMVLIDEYHLKYKFVGTILTGSELKDLVKTNIKPNSGRSCIGLDGRVRDDIFSSIRGRKTKESKKEDDELDAEKPQVTLNIETKEGEEQRKEREKLEEIQDEKDPVVELNANPTEEHAGSKDVNSNGLEFADSTKAGISNPRTESTVSERTTNTKPKEKSPLATKALDNNPVKKCAVSGKESSTKGRSLLYSQGDDLFNVAIQIILERIRVKHWDNFVNGDSGLWSKLIKLLWNKDQPVVPDDFIPMRVLGRGGFGLVTACKKATTGKLYAMKIMKKKRIKYKKSLHLALNERSVLSVIHSSFVISLKYAFQSKSDVYLVMDLMTGGDLSFHLNQKGRFLKNECQYYAARIMLGLQALHDKKYVYRDLKPENCLLSDDGRVRLTDLGLTTKITRKLSGAAGTRGYWAPEMLKKDENNRRLHYNHSVDWFSFGCVLAEMISGSNPFRTETALKFGRRALGKNSTKEKAVDYATMDMEPSFDKNVFEESAIDLCRALINKDPKLRLGSNGCKEIMRHNWFNEVDWDMIISDRQKPPFIPLRDINAASQSEIGNFERSGVKLDEKDIKAYQGWEWVNPNVFADEVIEMLVYERDNGPLIPISDFPSCCCTVI